MGLHPAVFSAGHGTWTERRAGWQFDHAHASPILLYYSLPLSYELLLLLTTRKMTI